MLVGRSPVLDIAAHVAYPIASHMGSAPYAPPTTVSDNLIAQTSLGVQEGIRFVDSVVLIRVRQRFGSSDDENGLEQNAPFVGRSMEYEFSCPKVDSSSDSSLLFQAQHVMHPQNRLFINGVNIAGGVPMGGFFVATPPQGPSFEVGIWSAQNLIIPPNTLRDQGNTLRVEARTSDGSTSGDMPNFIIDNVVLFFRTRLPRPVLEAEFGSRP